MEALNYHHLRLFQAVAREGNLTRASGKLHLTPQTVSTQVRDLEAAIGEQLFRRTGRRMVLTEAGKVTLRYADAIFSLGQELQQTLRGQPSGRRVKVLVGVNDVLPKLIVHHILEPALQAQNLHIVCCEGNRTQLLADLAVHRLDVVLSDSPIPPTTSVRAYNHLLGSCGVSFLAPPEMALRLRRKFPASLDGAPVLLPSDETVARRGLDRWFDKCGVRPVIVGEFDDSALLKSFGQAGEGFFTAPTVVEAEVARQYQVEPFGRTAEIVESYYAISVERRVRHPAVVTICEAARTELFS
jgi:LysR family transcriptional activator of nhaA